MRLPLLFFTLAISLLLITGQVYAASSGTFLIIAGRQFDTGLGIIRFLDNTLVTCPSYCWSLASNELSIDLTNTIESLTGNQLRLQMWGTSGYPKIVVAGSTNPTSVTNALNYTWFSNTLTVFGKVANETVIIDYSTITTTTSTTATTSTTYPPHTVVFHTTPTTFVGTTTPGLISACSESFTDGQSTVCEATFSATANLPSPFTGWKFDHWTWSGGVTCTTIGNTATCSSSLAGGSLTAVYAALVTFQTNPSSSGALISWGSCGALGEGNGQSINSTSYGSIAACYVPSGYTLSSWSCSNGLTCSGSNDPTLVTFDGPGTITLNLKTGSLTNLISTSLTAFSTPNSTHRGTMFTVSGTLTANGAGVGGEAIVLVFGWNTKMVNVTTKANGSYSYSVTAPSSPGPYNVDAFFLGDYTGNPQYLPSKATAMITVT